MEQADAFLAESQRLYNLLAPLSAAEMARPTGFKGWTIDHIIRHLHVWNGAADMSLKDEEAFKAFFARAAMAMQATSGMRPFEAAELNDMAGPKLLDLWRTGYERTARYFQDATPKQRVIWAGPSMSARSSITARLMETWSHGQAVYDLCGEVRRNTDDIKNIVMIGINTFGWTFKNRGETVPASMPYLSLNAPSGEVWNWGTPNTQEHISGPAEDFCQVVTQCRNIEDVNLSVTGPIATRWMSIAQCFAGQPETPPPPGTRKRTCQ